MLKNNNSTIWSHWGPFTIMRYLNANIYYLRSYPVGGGGEFLNAKFWVVKFFVRKWGDEIL